MGLDQYLYAKRYASNSEWTSDEKKRLFASIVEIANASEFVVSDFATASIGINVAYWRKQNAIHNWFVQNCQNGEDECQESYVERQKLAELRGLCRAVIARPSLAEEYLPTASGFFFGSTDYDSWYFDGLAYTADTIDKLLTMPDDWHFYYQSSW